MSKVAIEGNALGSGTFTIASPNTNTSYTLSLPQATTTLVGTDATQTLTNKTWASPASSTISSATAQASTSGTSIDFTGIPSWVKRITVMFNGVSLNGSSNILVQLGDSGGAENSGYVSQVGTVTQVSNTTRYSAYTTGFGFHYSGSASSYVYSGVMVFTLLSGNLWMYLGGSQEETVGGTSNCIGSKTLSDTLDRVRVTTTNGTDTFDAGSINILFE